jgi:hypothetical protein
MPSLHGRTRNRALTANSVPGVDPRLAWDLSKKEEVTRPIFRYIQAFEDCMYPWDPAVVKAVRAFDPRVVPLCSVSVYQHPDGSIEKYVRHCIALEQYPLEFKEPAFVNLLMPTSRASVNYGRHPNVWLKGWSGPQSAEKVTPGDYWPFDWEVFNFLHVRFQTYDGNAKKVMAERYGAEDEAKKTELEKLDAEIDYRLDEDRSYIEKAAKAVDRKLIERGISVDTTPNPFVHLGS